MDHIFARAVIADIPHERPIDYVRRFADMVERVASIDDADRQNRYRNRLLDIADYSDRRFELVRIIDTLLGE